MHDPTSFDYERLASFSADIGDQGEMMRRTVWVVEGHWRRRREERPGFRQIATKGRQRLGGLLIPLLVRVEGNPAHGNHQPGAGSASRTQQLGIVRAEWVGRSWKS